MKYIFRLTTSLIVITILLQTMGCATQGKSTGLGAGIGAGTGMAIGAIADPNADGQARTRNVIVGGALGAITGAIVGNAVFKSNENAKKEALQSVKPASPSPGQQPTLTQPKVETRWIDAKVTGGRYVEGHFEWVIVEPARWEGGQ